MGLWNKRVSDLTVGNLVGFALFIDFFSTLLNFSRSSRDTGTHPLQELRRNLEPEDYDRVVNLRQEKWLGMTPDGGWDQYRKFEPYLRNVSVKSKTPMHWPDWMKVPSSDPQSWTGRKI